MAGRSAWAVAIGVLVVGVSGCTGDPASTAPPVDYRADLVGVSQREACTLMDIGPAMAACRQDMVVVRDSMAGLMPTLPHDEFGQLFNTASSARLRAQQYLDSGCGSGDTITPSQECSTYSQDALVHTENLLAALAG